MSRGKYPAMYLKVKAQEEQRESEESARLLYVAATRAREMLLINGCMHLGKDNRPTGLGEWLQWLAGPLGLEKQVIAYEETGQGVIRLALRAGKVPVSCAVYEPGCSWQRAGAAEPEREVSVAVRLPLLAAYGASLGAAEGDREIPELGRRTWQVMPGSGRTHAPQWVVGELVHEALSAWRFPDAGFEAWAQARARTLGLTDAHQLHDAAARSAMLLRRFRGHNLYEEMRGATQRLAEVPYSRHGDDGRTESGVIDALIRQDSQWTIVEFKTDHVKDAVCARNIVQKKGYLQQAERYVRAVEELLGQVPQHLFCWLDYDGRVVCESLVGKR